MIARWTFGSLLCVILCTGADGAGKGDKDTTYTGVATVTRHQAFLMDVLSPPRGSRASREGHTFDDAFNGCLCGELPLSNGLIHCGSL